MINNKRLSLLVKLRTDEISQKECGKRRIARKVSTTRQNWREIWLFYPVRPRVRPFYGPVYVVVQYFKQVRRIHGQGSCRHAFRPWTVISPAHRSDTRANTSSTTVYAGVATSSGKQQTRGGTMHRAPTYGTFVAATATRNPQKF